MHELSIAQSLVELVEDQLAIDADAQSRGDDLPHRARVTQVNVRIGALAGVVPEALASAWRVSARSPSLRGAKLTVEYCPVAIRCGPCAADRTLSSIQSMRCPVCGTLSHDLVGGRELELTSIEVWDESIGTTANPPGADQDPQEQ